MNEKLKAIVVETIAKLETVETSLDMTCDEMHTKWLFYMKLKSYLEFLHSKDTVKRNKTYKLDSDLFFM